MTQKTIKFYADAAKTTQVYPELDSTGVTSALGYTPVNPNKIGANNGIAELDVNGKVPSSQLPSYVDDIVEGYYKKSNGKFYEDSAHTIEIQGETGKIYVSLDTNKTYRWSGSTFVIVASDLSLGETDSTAYRGDRGKIAYDHSQTAHAPSDAEVNIIDTIKINGVPQTVTDKAINIVIPSTDVVNDSTITIQKNSVDIDSFTTNQATDKIINLPIPTRTTDLINDSNFIDATQLNTKQDTLVSGTNIKTINNTSILGNGNIDVDPGIDFELIGDTLYINTRGGGGSI